MIGEGVVLGADCRIGAHASLSHALLGARVYIYPGARIGQEGFGFAPTDAGFVSVPQLGRVIIEDDVEVGANTTIDRGSAQDTVIGAGSRLDNLVQIGHNVRLGRCCVIVAQVGISGSTVLDDFVMVAGQAGFTGHLHIGRRARIGAQAGVMADVPAGAEVVGSPAMPVREFFRQVATLRRLAADRAGMAGGNEGERSRTEAAMDSTATEQQHDRGIGHHGGHRAHHARDPASLSVPDDRPRGRGGARPVRRSASRTSRSTRVSSRAISPAIR